MQIWSWPKWAHVRLVRALIYLPEVNVLISTYGSRDTSPGSRYKGRKCTYTQFLVAEQNTNGHCARGIVSCLQGIPSLEMIPWSLISIGLHQLREIGESGDGSCCWSGKRFRMHGNRSWLLRHRPRLKTEASLWKRFKCFPSTRHRWNLNFSNSLMIHQDKTKKITTVKEVWIPGLISIDFDDFASPFTPWVLFRLRRYITHSRQCFIGYPNTPNFVKNTPLRVVFFFFIRSDMLLPKYGICCLMT